MCFGAAQEIQQVGLFTQEDRIQRDALSLPALSSLGARTWDTYNSFLSASAHEQIRCT
jgi:hypothetical protein